MSQSRTMVRVAVLVGFALVLAGCVTSTRDLKVFQDNRDKMMLTSKGGSRR